MYVHAQALREYGGMNSLSTEFVGHAIKAVRIIRDRSPYTASVYVTAVATALFLRGVEGQQLLRDADDVGRAVMRLAKGTHAENAPGTILMYGWELLRKLHPRAPGPLRLWGQPKHAPPPEALGARRHCRRLHFCVHRCVGRTPT